MSKKLILYFVFLGQIMYSTVASPNSITLTQPDGTNINCYIRGDEWQNWYETDDGYTIAKDEQNRWVYVLKTDGVDFILSDIAANSPVITGIPKHIRPESANRTAYSPVIDLKTLTRTEFEVPMLLIDFPDMLWTYPLENIDSLMNADNYITSHGETGSFNHFYLENSYGAFDPHTTIYGWFTAPLEHDVYGSSAPNGWDLVRQLIRDAVDQAEAQGIDWTLYDNDANGTVDALNIIHAGFGAEEGDGSNIWSHRWSLGGYAVEYDGVLINDYTINPEKQGQNSNPEIVNIGVICHEFGHALGLPDLYDTDYSSSGIGTWGLMSGGSWGGNGNSAWYPAHFSAWSKVTLGWVDPIIVTEGSITVEIPNVEENPVIYKMDGIGPEYEYFLFENRQKILSDQTLINSGLLIWHIDDSMSNNTNDWHRLVDLEQADGDFDLNNGFTADMSDPFPGSHNISEFTDYTVPNSQLYSNQSSSVSVLNIVENDMLITANFRNLPSIYIPEFDFTEQNGDGDGVANPGEIAQITTLFNNPSSEIITSLTANIFTDDPDINIIDETIDIMDLQPYSDSYAETFSFDIADDAVLGTHSLSLEIFGLIEAEVFDQIIELEFDITIFQKGFPYHLSNKVIASPLIFDIDDDNSSEIIFGDYNGLLHVLNSDGTVYSENFPFDTGDQIWGSPAAADIDNDGITELIVNSKSKHLFVIEQNGNVQLDFDAGQFLVGTPALGNLDNDDDLEIVFGSMSSSGQVFVLNPDGTPVNGFPIQIDEKIYNGSGLADCDGNGKDDIAIGTDAGNLYLIYDDGTLAPEFPINFGNKIRSAPTIIDLDLDGSPEILIGCDDGLLHVIGADGLEYFTYDAGYAIRTSPSILDYNGILGIFFGTENGQVCAVSSYGESLFGWPQTIGQTVSSSVVFGDLNDDGAPEIISAAKSGELFVHNLDGTAFSLFPMVAGSSIECSPVITDIENDGDLEILTGYSDGVFGLDWKEPGNADSWWNMYRGNNYRNGYYSISDEPIQIGDVNLDEIVDILDLVLIVAIIIDEYTPTPGQFTAADFNGDGIINIQDLILLIDLILF